MVSSEPQAQDQANIVQPSRTFHSPLERCIAFIMGAKRSRPRTSHFAVHELVEKWKHLLALRDVGFRWDGSSYQGKGTSIHIDSMILHEPALHGLLEVAPSGFPSHGDLRATIAHLQDKLGILSDDKVVTQTARDDATEAWRLMAKHAYNLAKDKSPSADVPQLQSLIAKIVLPKFETLGSEDDISMHGSTCGQGGAEVHGSVSSHSADAPLQAAEVAKMFDLSDCEEENDVEVISMRCSCPECARRLSKARSLGVITIDDECKHMTASIPIPNPMRGQQRLDSVLRASTSR